VKLRTAIDGLKALFARPDESSVTAGEKPYLETRSSLESTRHDKQDEMTGSGYTEPRAHLLEELRWLNRLLAAHVLRMRQVHFYESARDFRGFFIAEKEVDALITSGLCEADSSEVDVQRSKSIRKLIAHAGALREEIDKRVEDSRLIELPIVKLRQRLGLNDPESQALLICIAPFVDSRYERLYAYLHNDLTRKDASIDLIAGLLDLTFDQRVELLKSFGPTAPLRYHRLVEQMENDSGNSLAVAQLHADPQIVRYVLGQRTIDQRLQPYLRVLPPLKWDDVAIDSDLRARLLRVFKRTYPEETGAIFVLHGHSGVGKKSIARALCGEVGHALAVIDTRALMRTPDRLQEHLQLIHRESLLQDWVVCFDSYGSLQRLEEEDPSAMAALIATLNEFEGAVFLCGKTPVPSRFLDLPSSYAFEIPRPGHRMQQKLWNTALSAESVTVESGIVNEITSRFDLTGGQIVRACRQAKYRRSTVNPDSIRVELADLCESCRSLTQPQLGTLARKIKPRFTWDDVILPADQIAHLKEIANQVKNRQTVLGEWGFNAKLSLGRGVSALFTGPTGTGKTMCAEVLANELALDLFKIDLSAIVSKYIGETEKNLSRVFSEAEHSNAILFFDEADALLGKRSEVKDAHDRFANIEIAYLLQKMEEFEGVVILATNLRKNMDDAFVRRIQFIVEFPFPGESDRKDIWRSMFPSAAPLAENIDFGFLARQFQFTGGNIKNVCLRAAYLSAAENDGAICMDDILRSTTRELQKMGKTYSETDFGKYGIPVSRDTRRG
jgi:ATP-dependent 26S proteasome regulatory subunit